jgi:DNA uptake protein ComE-like DNA-binding protein
MTLQHTPRRQDQAVQIGPRHGYRIEGDHVFIHTELEVPPHHSSSSGETTLELWATEQPYREGPLTGVKVAELALELPTPIGPYVQHVDSRAAARLPLQGRAYAMVLALVEHAPDGQTSVRDFANYPEPETFTAPRLEGTVSYAVEGQEVVLEVDGIYNPRSSTNLSGTLSLELWAFPVSGPATEGVRLAVAEVDRVAGQARLSAVAQRVAFCEPPVGEFQVALLLSEWTFAHGYVARDRRNFRSLYERAAPPLPGSSEGRSPVTVATPARPSDRLRLVPPTAEAVAEAAAVAPAEVTAPATATAAPTAAAAPAVPTAAAAAAAVPTAPTAAAAPARAGVVAPRSRAPVEVAHQAASPAGPVVPGLSPPVVVSAPAAPVPQIAPRTAARGLVSIQTGSVDELAGVKGLNHKLAKEIIKARPFASIADLIRVRGLGQKTIDRLKSLVTL